MDKTRGTYVGGEGWEKSVYVFFMGNLIGFICKSPAQTGE